MIRTQLYFGLTIGNTESLPVRVIHRKHFWGFVNREIAKKFEGFTVQSADGYWKGQHEKVMIVTIVSEMTPNQNAWVEMIRDSYMRSFEQESVMRIDDKLDNEWGSPIF